MLWWVIPGAVALFAIVPVAVGARRVRREADALRREIQAASSITDAVAGLRADVRSIELPAPRLRPPAP